MSSLSALAPRRPAAHANAEGLGTGPVAGPGAKPGTTGGIRRVAPEGSVDERPRDVADQRRRPAAAAAVHRAVNEHRAVAAGVGPRTINAIKSFMEISAHYVEKARTPRRAGLEGLLRAREREQ